MNKFSEIQKNIQKCETGSRYAKQIPVAEDIPIVALARREFWMRNAEKNGTETSTWHYFAVLGHKNIRKRPLYVP
jgi:hypothetical protein